MNDNTTDVSDQSARLDDERESREQIDIAGDAADTAPPTSGHSDAPTQAQRNAEDESPA